MDVLLEPEKFLESFGVDFSASCISGQTLIALESKGRHSNKRVEVDNAKRTVLRELLQHKQLAADKEKGETATLCTRHRDINIPSIVSRQRGLLEPVELGSLDQIFDTDLCPLCRLLQHYLYKVFLQELLLPGAPIECRFLSFKGSYSEESDFSPASSRVYAGLKLQLARFGPNFEPKQEFGILDNGFHLITDSEYSCRKVNEQIDINLTKSWLQKCQAQHGRFCQHQNREASPDLLAKLRLVDVHTRKVVTCSDPCTYLALSYVWGAPHKQPFRSRTENSMDVQGHIIDLHLPKSLPRTIEDAIYLTQQLGFQFLWVDVLCIIQDNTDHKKAQIARMGQIYYGATMTIAAAGGQDVEAPLHGVKARSRHMHQISEKIKQETLANILPRSKSAIGNSAWNSRAWTFQERVLSHRCLILTPYQAYFHCSQESWCEDTDAESVHSSPSNRTMNNHALIHSLPTLDDNAVKVFETYAFLVNSFTKRKLSFPKDTLKAFQGTIGILEETHHLRFFQGLPKQFIARALLWQPLQPLQRITSWGGLVHQQWDESENVKAFLPSWTWAAWSGEVRYLDDENNIKCNFVIEESYNASKSNEGLTGCQDLSWILTFPTECTMFNIERPNPDVPFGTSSSAWDVKTFQAVKGLEGEKRGTLRNALILDYKGREAGEILLDIGLKFPFGKHKFILICVAETITRSVWRRGWGGDIDEHYKDEDGELQYIPAVPEKPWSYVKVMLIYQSNGFTYRLGVGTIHKEAWEFHEPEKELIQLT